MNNKIQLIGRLSEDIDIFGKGVATLTVVPFDDYANQEPQKLTKTVLLTY